MIKFVLKALALYIVYISVPVLFGIGFGIIEEIKIPDVACVSVDGKVYCGWVIGYED